MFWWTYKEYFSCFERSIVLTMLKSTLKPGCKVQDVIIFLKYLKRAFWSFIMLMSACAFFYINVTLIHSTDIIHPGTWNASKMHSYGIVHLIY